MDPTGQTTRVSRSTLARVRGTRQPQCTSTPFANAAEAWFWTAATLRARRAVGTVAADRGSNLTVETADEILRCLDQLYRHRRIDLLHARILRVWGERGRSPDPKRHGEGCDARIWQEAIERLEWPLRVRGIVNDPS